MQHVSDLSNPIWLTSENIIPKEGIQTECLTFFRLSFFETVNIILKLIADVNVYLAIENEFMFIYFSMCIIYGECTLENASEREAI